MASWLDMALCPEMVFRTEKAFKQKWHFGKNTFAKFEMALWPEKASIQKFIQARYASFYKRIVSQ